jgi:hypothetical protein
MADIRQNTARVLLLLVSKGALEHEMVAELITTPGVSVDAEYDAQRDDYMFRLRDGARSWGTIYGAASLATTWMLIRGPIIARHVDDNPFV